MLWLLQRLRHLPLPFAFSCCMMNRLGGDAWNALSKQFKI
jgi:hypothetical protein